MKKVVIVLSGGLDSSVTAYKMAEAGYKLVALHFSYGQRTETREKRAFNDIADSLNIESRYEIDLPFFKEIGVGKSSLIDGDMKLNESGVGEDIPDSYVPFRNGIMLSIATAVIEKESANGVAIGVVEEDSSGYPDCRESFIDSFQRAINLGTELGEKRDIEIFRPLVDLKKSEIVREAIRLGVPLEKSWSCYQSSEKACGVCDSCRLRLQGFKLAGATDPIPYREVL